MTATSPSRASRSWTGERRPDLLEDAELFVDEGVVDLGLELRHLELRPVGGLDGALNRELGLELPAFVVGRGQLVVELGRLGRPDAVSPRGIPEPA